MLKKNILIAILIVLFPIYLIGQNFHFKNISRQQGLSSNFITSIHQDGYGFMWFGTSSGLNRFDGKFIETYKRVDNDSTSLNSDYVRDVLSTSSGKLLVANRLGVNVFDYKYEHFTKIKSLNSVNVSRIVEDKSKNIWVITANNVVVKLDSNLNKAPDFSFINLIKAKFDITSSGIKVLKYDDNNLLFYIKNKGFYLFNFSTQDFVLLSNNPLPIHSSNIYKVLKINDSEFWVANMSGIFVYKNGALIKHISAGNTSMNLNNSFIHDLQRVNTDEVWVFTDGGGINIYNLTTNKIKFIKQNRRDDFSIVSNFLYTSYLDKDSNLWVGSIKNGVSKLISNHPFKTYKLRGFKNDLRSDYSVSSLFRDSKNRIWVGSDGNGLYELKNNKVQHVISNNKVNTIPSIYEYNDKLLLGTYKNGIYSYDISNNIITDQSLINYFPLKSRVNVIGTDKNRNIIIAGYHALIIENSNRKEDVLLKPDGDIIKKTILSIYNETEKYTLFGTGNGLFRLDDNGVALLSFSPKGIRSIVKFKDSQYWLATDQGVCLYDIETNETTFYSYESGLNSSRVAALIKDNSNNLWISNSLGVSKFDIKNKRFTNFTYKDGFQDNEFVHPNVIRSPNGRLYFGGLNGILAFNPKEIKQSEKSKKVGFTKLLINHKELGNVKKEVIYNYVGASDNIELDYTQKVITINYSAFEFDYPEKINYLYKLDGYDTEWQTTNSSSLTYMNLDPGDYTLKIKASNATGDWGERFSSIKIKVIPAWWQTIWFKILIVLVLIVIIYFSVDFIIKRERDKRNHEFEKKSLEDQKVLDENQIRFFTNLSHEIRTPLSLIISPIRMIINRKTFSLKDENNLNLIEKNALRIERLINRGIDFRRTQFKEPELQAEHIEIINFLKELADGFTGLSESKNIRLKFESNVNELMIWFDRYMLETIFFNLLSNAFKYSHENGDVILSVTANKDTVQIKIKDFGVGISEDDTQHIFERFFQSKNHIGGSGIGLALTKRFVNAHKGEISVKSTLREGSCFVVELLLGEAHISKEYKKIVNKNKPVISDSEKESIVENFDLQGEVNQIKAFINTILIVEDERDLREYLSNNLSKMFNVLLAKNGKDALDIINENKIDLVVSDVMMPLMDGFELCSKLKSKTETNDIPVILLTAKALSKDKKIGYESGADAYIEKPFDFELLLARIKNLLSKRETIRNKLLESLDIDIEKDSIANYDKLFLEKCITIMGNHLSNPAFNVTVFSRELGMSKSLVYKKLKEISDSGISDLMLKFRMNKATHLLMHTNKSVADISILIGFKNTKYFSTAFKKNYGMSPLKYRTEQLQIKNRIQDN